MVIRIYRESAFVHEASYQIEIHDLISRRHRRQMKKIDDPDGNKKTAFRGIGFINLYHYRWLSVFVRWY